MNVLPNFLDDKPAPIKKVGDPVPVWTMTDQATSVAPWCIAPLLLHYAYMKITGWTLHPIAAYALYMSVYQGFSIWTTRRTTLIGQIYGHFDGEKPRDGVPDDQDWHVLLELVSGSSLFYSCVGLLIALSSPPRRKQVKVVVSLVAARTLLRTAV